MPHAQSESMHQAIHHALRDGDFESVLSLSEELGKAVKREAANVNERERAALLQNSLFRLQENLGLARVLRAHVASQLQTNTAVYLYQSDIESDHSWRFEG